MTQANDERAARKQYIRRRQKVVFTITGTILTIALVISLLFFFHVGGLGNVKSAAVQPNYGQQAPCAAQEQDGSKGKYVENRNITVRVLNGTEFAGFAQAVSSALPSTRPRPVAGATAGRPILPTSSHERTTHSAMWLVAPRNGTHTFPMPLK